MPGAFKYIPTHEVDARHRAKAKVSPRESRMGEQRNVEAVLALGSTRYITYRGQLLAIPPVPFKLGEQLLDVYSRSLDDAKKVARTGDKKLTASYYRHLSVLAKLLWSHIQPVGRVKRALKRAHLLRNVFQDASEKEIQDITNFFFQGRMMSTVQVTEKNL